MNRLIFALLLAAQTTITPPDNKYSPADDVKLGLQAKADAERQLPIMHDDAVTSYIDGIGRRLVAVIPANLRHPEFRYTFEAVNVREINAFALPGGPMFVNRGMIEAARTEGEVAGVMAHELSHVVLRHGTAQASKATKYEIGTIAGAVIGAIIGGNLGSIVAQGTQFGLGTAFLRFSREYERQADIEGSHIMAAAGYDPRELASMFTTIAKQGGSGAPQWLSDHPDPGNREQYITREAQLLHIDNPVRDTRAFDQVRAHLKQLPPAPTTEQATKSAGRNGQPSGQSQPLPTGRVAPPSSQFTTYTEGGLFRVSVPSNWREMPGANAVTFAPDGAYGQSNGQGVFTHGAELGATRNETHDLQTATGELIASLSSGNPNLGRPSGYDNVSVAGRKGLRTTMSNKSEVTGQPETIEVFTTLMRDGSVFYVVGVAPRDSFRDYQNTFQRIVGSIQLMD
jgi:Zn-dependent protease with chaperone function